MTRYWFKPHQYGFGATPIAWQGWALAAIDLVIVLAAVAGLVLEGRDAEFSAQLPWLLVILVVTLVSVLISWWKTEGSWRWRWGGKHD
jgi:hypothetical protein